MAGLALNDVVDGHRPQARVKLGDAGYAFERHVANPRVPGILVWTKGGN